MDIVEDIDQLINDYKPPEMIWVYLPDGRRLGFRPNQRSSEQDDFRTRAAEWFVNLPKRGSEGDAAHPVLSGVIPVNAKEAAKAFLIHEQSETPKIGLRQALKMLEAPSLIDHIYDTILLESKNVQRMAQAALVQAALGKSSETSTTDAG